MKISKHASFALNGCRVSPADNSLYFATDTNQALQSVSLQPKFIEVLSYLARHHPKVVTREELIEDIWEGNHYVGSKALTNAIWHLRQQLKGVAGDEAAIDTVRKTGYRLLIAPEFDAADLVDEPDLLEKADNKIAHLSQLNRRIIAIFGALLVVILGFVLTHLYLDSVRYTPKLQTRLTSDAGSELYPVVSPDGRWLVYGARGVDGYASLYLKDLHTPSDTPKQLTSSNSKEIRAVWSPDGSALYFASELRANKQCFITRLELDSNQTNTLAACDTYSAGLDVSPDGRYLVFVSADEQVPASGLYQLDLSEQTPQAVRISCDTECSYRDRDLAFSPDGRWLAIARRFGNISEDLFMREWASGIEHRLTRGFEDMRGLSWHPDGKRLVFSSENSGVRNGFIVTVASKKVEPLHVEGLSYPRFVPLSHDIVYANYMRDHRLSRLDLAQHVPTTPFPLLRVEYSYRNPDYSTISKRLVYVSNETGFNEIWSANIEGNERKQHTALKRRVAYPSWSHDGKKVAFLAPDDKSEGNKIHVLDVASGNITVLATAYLDHQRPSWGWDDSFIVANTYDGITRFYLDNRLPEVISGVDMRLGKMVNANILLFSRADKLGLWSMDINKPLIIEEVIAAEQFFERYNWDVTDKGVYFRQNGSSHQLIAFWRFSTQLVTPILKLPPSSLPRHGAISYVADNESLLLTESENYKRDVIRLQHRLLQ
ncbi:winged helix-turn-helix domain-containing protein [Shewanella waksmanii]|uniref:winged helix-turn-helix domain-containing protein n=1 Tax=Shewanella waksmanii TaxID=213783 RepID=UPI00048F8B36|nr:winged helix-turn-helix domain-containing protein [Shewanella waksmanii]